MSPDLMRKIDRFVGVPLCFLLTVWNRILRRFRKPQTISKAPRSLLFIELAEVGAFVVAYPAVARAKERFPGAKIYFLTFSRGPEILKLMNIADDDRIITIRPDNFPAFVFDTLRAVLKLRREKIDASVNLEVFTRFSTILAYLSGAKRRAGFQKFHEEGLYTGDLVTHKVLYNPHLHAARAYISLIEALGEAPGKEPAPKVRLDRISLALPLTPTSPEARNSIIAKIKGQYPEYKEGYKLVLLNPNASDIVVARRWPDEYFIKLAHGLLSVPDVLLVLTGAPDEREKAAALARKINSERVLNLAGKTTLRELLDLYNVGSLLVTNDSGPAHFASLTSIPVLVLFGPETPRIFGPLGPNVEPVYLGLACSPCVSAYNQKLSPCSDNQCLKKIRPEDILEKARNILDRKKIKQA